MLVTIIGSITFKGDRLTFAPLGAPSVLQQAQAPLNGKIHKLNR